MNEELEKIRAKLSTIVRDITAIGWAPKSEAKRLMSGLLDEAFQAGRTSAVSEIRPQVTELRERVLAAVFGTKNRVELLQRLDKILEGMNHGT